MLVDVREYVSRTVTFCRGKLDILQSLTVQCSAVHIVHVLTKIVIMSMHEYHQKKINTHTCQQPIHYIPYAHAHTNTRTYPPPPPTHTGAQHPNQLKCALQSGQHPHSTAQRTTNLCTL